MPRGGARNGAGRKKSGANAINAEARQRAAETGDLPLDFLLAAMRDVNNEFGVRMDAAKAAAPYVHARLAAVDTTVKGADGGAIVFKTIYEAKPGA